jgi:hypothetical protein
MALHEVIQKLDFRQPAQRLLASSACIGLGALAAYQGTTTTPAGLLAGVLGVIGANVLSADVHGAVTRRLGRPKQVFRNHDLTQVVGKAIGLVIEKVAEDPRLSGEQSGLRRLAKAAPGYWDTIAPLTATDEAFEPLSESMLLRFVAVTADDFEAITEAARGPDHPDTARSLNNLAGLLWAQGKNDEAEPLYRRAWEVVRNVPGHHHPSSVRVLKNYLFVLRINGRNTEYKSVLSKIDPSRAKDVKQTVNAGIKAHQRRRGL